jgi:hypothetical protein
MVRRRDSHIQTADIGVHIRNGISFYGPTKGREELMSEQSIGVFIAILTILITGAQFIFSWLSGRRQRDAELTTWAHKVLETMAEIETACFPISSGTVYSPKECEILSYRASALVDKGRLFFPNVINKKSDREDQGTRVKILDQVLRACYAARYLAAEKPIDGEKLRAHVWAARKNFTILLQAEMGKSMRKSPHDQAGEHIPLDPNSWGEAGRQLKLPSSFS